MKEIGSSKMEKKDVPAVFREVKSDIHQKNNYNYQYVHVNNESNMIHTSSRKRKSFAFAATC